MKAESLACKTNPNLDLEKSSVYTTKEFIPLVFCV